MGPGIQRVGTGIAAQADVAPAEDGVAQLRDFFQRYGKLLLIAPVVILVVTGALTSHYIVQPEEEAVVKRFGRVIAINQPGIHFKIPFGVDTVQAVPTARVLKEEFEPRLERYSREARTQAWSGWSVMRQARSPSIPSRTGTRTSTSTTAGSTRSWSSWDPSGRRRPTS